MGELEDKLNSILSSPEEMEKIMNIARSISGGASDSETDSKENLSSNGGAASFPLGDIDPQMLKMMSRVMEQYGSGGDDGKALILNTLKPYLKEERRQKVDEALKIARMAKLAKIAFSEFSGGDSHL